jgi:hypothetical protein
MTGENDNENTITAGELVGNGMGMAKKRIYNPVTGHYYEIRQKSSKYGQKGQIKGLWSQRRNSD